MKKVIIILLAFVIHQQLFAQSEKEKVEKTCLNYIEGFYEGDTVKICYALPGGETPTEFSTKEKQHCFVLKRTGK